MYDNIKKILDYAVWAPSGDNSQPWRFRVTGGDIKVFNAPEKDTSLYNYNQHASLVALGGLIKNIKIASSHFGYEPSIIFFPEGQDSYLTAIVSLTKTNSFTEPLFSFIKKRATNRKPYSTRVLSPEQKREILRVADTLSDVSIKLIDGREKVERLADAASVNEKVVLENKKLHEFFFHSITWDEKEDKQKRGFFIKTLELKGPQVVAFKVFRHWPILKFFNRVGVSNLVSRDNAKLYKRSGAFVAIVASNSSAMSFLKSGMLAQSFWLTTTMLGLWAQPLTGVLFLHHRIATGGGGVPPVHISLIEKAYTAIKEVFGIEEGIITMMFRVGYADEPSAKCLRCEPEINF